MQFWMLAEGRGRIEQYRCILDILRGSVLSNVVDLFVLFIALFVSNQEKKRTRDVHV
jgi:hypothetical protein